MAEFIGNVASGVSLEDVLSGIEKAKTNKNIKRNMPTKVAKTFLKKSFIKANILYVLF